MIPFTRRGIDRRKDRAVWGLGKRIEPVVAEGVKVMQQAREGLGAAVTLLLAVLAVSVATLVAVLTRG